jgi:hypothetical protein
MQRRIPHFPKTYPAKALERRAGISPWGLAHDFGGYEADRDRYSQAEIVIVEVRYCQDFSFTLCN